MKILLSILILTFSIGCATTKVENKPAVIAGAEEENAILLKKGIQTLSSGNPKESIAKYFDPIIEYYNNEYGDYDKRVYCSRGSAETLFYLNESIKRNEMAISIYPLWSLAVYYKGYASLELGNIEDAKKYLNRALELSPSNSVYLSELGHIYERERNWSKAAELYRKAEESAKAYSPENLKKDELTRAMRGRGYILIELGRLDEAEEIYKKCLEIDDKDKIALNELEYIHSVRNKNNP